MIQTNCTDITGNCIISSHPLRRHSSGRMEAVFSRRLRGGGGGGEERAVRAAALLVAELTRVGATLGAQTDSCRDDEVPGLVWLVGGAVRPLRTGSSRFSDRSGRTSSGPGGNERPVRLVC